MSDKRDPSSKTSARLDDLKAKVDRASALIGELREANYSLNAELADLRNRLDASGEPAPLRASKRSGGELELLRTERETIRKKLKSLIERIEKLESR